jgi:hypothetical protein
VSVAINLGQDMPCLASAAGLPVELPHLLKVLRKPAPPLDELYCFIRHCSHGPQGCAEKQRAGSVDSCSTRCDQRAECYLCSVLPGFSLGRAKTLLPVSRRSLEFEPGCAKNGPPTVCVAAIGRCCAMTSRARSSRMGRKRSRAYRTFRLDTGSQLGGL